MKIGVYDPHYRHYGEQTYQKLKSYGFSCVDYSMANTDTALYSCGDEAFREKLLHDKKLVEEAGLEVSQVHGPWRWPPRDNTPEDLKERREKMKRSIQGTALLNCKYWVVHPIMPFGTNDKGTAQAKVTLDMNRTFMRELLKTSKQYDVTICLENMPMPGFSIGSPSEILEFVKWMNDEHFKICLDTGHVAVYRDLSPADAMRMLGHEVQVLHIHDNNGMSDQHLFPYFGVIDWKDFGQALKECQYTGTFSLETSPPTTLPESIFEEMNILLVKLAKEIIKAGK